MGYRVAGGLLTSLCAVSLYMSPAAPMSAAPRPDAAIQLARTGPPLPADAVGIAPGAKLRVQVPGEAQTLCTTGFIFQDQQANYYLSTAGHCVLPETATATHGGDADYNASDVKVSVLERDCTTACRYVAMGPVLYARQKGLSREVGNDIAFVLIPPIQHHLITPGLPTWGGPSRILGASTGTPLLLYGQGTGTGSTNLTRARSGATVFTDAVSFLATGQASLGDSGSPVVTAKPVAGAQVAVGDGAVGILTHGIPGGTFQGTTIARAISLVAIGTGKSLSLVTANP